MYDQTYRSINVFIGRLFPTVLLKRFTVYLNPGKAGKFDCLQTFKKVMCKINNSALR